jgi:DNA transformation protein
LGVAQGDIDRAVELFSALGGITTRRMMGGLCLYHHGTVFAIMMGDGAIFLKGRGAVVADLEAAGATRWSYPREGRDQPVRMAYWTLPEEALDEPELACDWARRALAHL